MNTHLEYTTHCHCGKSETHTHPNTTQHPYCTCGQLPHAVDATNYKNTVQEICTNARQERYDRAHNPETSQKDAEDGLLAEISYCLLMCPTRLPELLEKAQHGGRNEGNDFPAEWTGLNKPTETKYTKYYHPNPKAKLGILFIRRPATHWDLDPARDIHDSYYVLLVPYQRTSKQIICWTDKKLFLTAGSDKVDKLQNGGRPTWGNYWFHFNKFDTFNTMAKRRTSTT